MNERTTRLSADDYRLCLEALLLLRRRIEEYRYDREEYRQTSLAPVLALIDRVRAARDEAKARKVAG